MIEMTMKVLSWYPDNNENRWIETKLENGSDINDRIEINMELT